MRSLDVVSRRLATIGRCDTLELAFNESVTVVAYKATSIRRRLEVADAMTTQVALQVIALREMG